MAVSFLMKPSYRPSFLDRLSDGPGPSTASHHVRRSSLAEIKDNVARDLEALLNTRNAQDATRLDLFPEARKSILAFGIADFSSLSLANPEHRQSICSSIEAAIAHHEPRLRDVLVSLSVESSTLKRLSFVINAVLMVEHGKEHVSFDAQLQPLTLQYAISQRHNGVREASRA